MNRRCGSRGSARRGVTRPRRAPRPARRPGWRSRARRSGTAAGGESRSPRPAGHLRAGSCASRPRLTNENRPPPVGSSLVARASLGSVATDARPRVRAAQRRRHGSGPAAQRARGRLRHDPDHVPRCRPRSRSTPRPLADRARSRRPLRNLPRGRCGRRLRDDRLRGALRGRRSDGRGWDDHLDELCTELAGLPSSRGRPPARDIRPVYRERCPRMPIRAGCSRVRPAEP